MSALNGGPALSASSPRFKTFPVADMQFGSQVLSIASGLALSFDAALVTARRTLVLDK